MWAVLFLSQYSSRHWPVPLLGWMKMLCRVSASTDGVEAAHPSHFCHSKDTQEGGRKRDVKKSRVRCVSRSADGNRWKNSGEEGVRQWGTHRFWELWRCCIFNSRPLCSNLCLIDSLPLKSSRQSPTPPIVPPRKWLRPYPSPDQMQMLHT